MKILSIKTDRPEAEIAVYEGETRLKKLKWEAHRSLAKTIHTQIKKLLESTGTELRDIGAVAVFIGPGSFTGLRIGVTIANALADGLKIPIIGASGRDWQQYCIEHLLAGKNQQIVLPNYGAVAKTTVPKK